MEPVVNLAARAGLLSRKVQTKNHTPYAYVVGYKRCRSESSYLLKTAGEALAAAGFAEAAAPACVFASSTAGVTKEGNRARLRRPFRASVCSYSQSVA